MTHLTNTLAVERAFSKQAELFDEDDLSNLVLTNWRKIIYQHVASFLKPESNILELNAGTGIDAVHFAKEGHHIMAIDIAEGMIQKLNEKIVRYNLAEKICTKLCSYESLYEIRENNFDFIFSNFGGLNCSEDLARVTKELPRLLKPGGYLTWVIMPPISPWELSWIFKGNKYAFRRLNRKTITHLEGEYFNIWYYSLKDCKTALGKDFNLVKAEGLGSISPSPHSLRFIDSNPGLYKWLRYLENKIRHLYPFNRCGDHIIMTFRKIG